MTFFSISSFVILVSIIQSIAQQRLDSDVITVSNFLPRPSPTLGTPMSGRPVPVGVDVNIPVAPPAESFTSNNPTPVPTSQNSGSSEQPLLRLLPIPNSPSIFRCNPKNTHPHPKTHKLVSQCRENTFCSSSGPTNGTCVPILCRRDEFPFGFGFGGGSSNANTGILDPNLKLNELNLPIPIPTPKTRKKSRKDRPKDLTTTMPLPPLCLNGTFCPDDGSGCRPQNKVGGTCELDRDEQCAHLGNLTGIPSTNTTAIPELPICLHLTCM